MLRFSGWPSLLLAFAGGFALVLPSWSISDEIAALKAFKNAIYEDPFSRLSSWNPGDENPCQWTGLRCSYPQGSVISIVLSNSSLEGFLTPQLGMLHWLQELVLDNNLLIGSIPCQLSMLRNLLVLDFSVNQLSGSIPPAFGNLTSIRKIDLHSNRLIGSIPSELGQLANLVELWLDRNMLDGVIPGSDPTNMPASQSNASGLCQLTPLGVANFSYNYFIGKIPSCLNYLPRSSFQGNCFSNDGSIFQRSEIECKNQVKSVLRNSMHSNEAPRRKNLEGHKLKNFSQPLWLLILEIFIGSLLLAFIITCVFTSCNGCKTKPSIFSWRKFPSLKDTSAVSIDPNLLKHAPRMNYQELEASCEDFSNIIGSHLHSLIYKGTLKNGPEIAVLSISISGDRWTSSHEHSFLTEVADLSRITHKNTAKLLGYCQENTPFSRMVVFEYASNGTLHEHFNYGDECQLTWFRRMKIAIGIACGLRYLHTELHPPLTISELTSNSVYLTEDFSPKLVDFERWNNIISKSKRHSGHIINDDSISSIEDPQPHRTQFRNVENNIYSFGVILLELMLGKSPYCQERGILLDWVKECLERPEEREKLIDPQLGKIKPEDLAIVCNVVSLCLESDPTKRPSMQIISAMLEDGIDFTAAAVLKESSLPCWI